MRARSGCRFHFARSAPPARPQGLSPPARNRRQAGTTLLVKGLGFDHAIALDAASLSRKQLCVALTRGAKSLTIVSRSVLSPAD
jgi:hypothetical protein